MGLLKDLLFGSTDSSDYSKKKPAKQKNLTLKKITTIIISLFMMTQWKAMRLPRKKCATSSAMTGKGSIKFFLWAIYDVLLFYLFL